MLDKYLSFTEKNGECLEWTRCFNTDGYPRAANKLTSNLKVHREVFYLVNGFYPPLVRHTCDNIKCINPDHLLEGTPQENTKDRHSRNRTANQIPDEEYDNVKALMSFGLKRNDISKTLGIEQRRVEYIISKVRKAG